MESGIKTIQKEDVGEGVSVKSNTAPKPLLLQ